MSEPIDPPIPEGVINLSPEAIARDHKLRALYESLVAAQGTPEETAAYEAFVRFIREEYP